METFFDPMQSQEQTSKEKLKDDLRTLVRDTEDLVKATAGDVSEKAKEVRSRVTVALTEAKATLQEKTTAAAKVTDQTIRAHPYESIGVAFGLGLLIGVLVARTR